MQLECLKLPAIFFCFTIMVVICICTFGWCSSDLYGRATLTGLVIISFSSQRANVFMPSERNSKCMPPER
ncbi:unnamed protein product [Protopolystoma xenopodis]|uniref:Uncharacterized protein n=1 Tax=Protopolystoma xenopodis TaxID=117903 RepID=A0A3S5C161_9PLAT|nr:unnamed protein product [Protopolystoma xenopodis]